MYPCIILAAVLVMVGCGSNDPSPANSTEEAPRDPRSRDAAAIDAIGIDGERVRQRIDGTLRAIEEREQAAQEVLADGE